MINNQYIVRKLIGEGRSKVFLCSDRNFPGKDFAIKILGNIDNPKELEAFQNEFFIIRKLNHPYIIKAYEYGTILELDDRIKSYGIKEYDKFFILDYFEGVSLSEYPQIRNEKTLSEITVQICSALYYLHQSNYIYHDLKPENILINQVKGKTLIKFIDFGLARFLPEDDKTNVRGTPYFIAPEILRMDPFDHRVDFYSLGISLYKIIYGNFPFESEKEIEIYKAHIEKEFEFPPADFSDNFLSIVKKLLSKNPAERYETSLQILSDLKEPILSSYKQHWGISKTFCDRKEVISNIKAYFKNKDLQEAIIIRGNEGSGKTSLLEALAAMENSVILLQNNNENRHYYWKTILNKILYLDNVYSVVDPVTKQNILNLIEKESGNLVEDLKSIFMQVSQKSHFVLLMDDFNLNDDFTIELFKEIIPILQVNGIKVIIAEDTNKSIAHKFINNIRIYSLTSFTDQNLLEFLDKSFFSMFPKKEIGQLINSLTDLLPGNIVRLINDLIFLNVLDFTYSGPKVRKNAGVQNYLKESQNEIYQLQLTDLSENERRVVESISLFEINIDKNILSVLLDISDIEISEIIENLRSKNIFYQPNVSLSPRFTSQSFAKYVYENLPSKKEKHFSAGDKIEKHFPDFSKSELARQYELAEKFEKCYDVVKILLKEAESKSAITYKRKILEQLLVLPLQKEIVTNIKIDLCKTLFRLGEFKLCFDLIEQLLPGNIAETDSIELLVQKGICLINFGELSSGKDLLQSLLPDITDETKKQFINTEIANADIYLNNYETAASACNEIISSKLSSKETKGLAYNLLGLVELYEKNNLDGTIENFKKSLSMFEESNLPSRIAGAELNLGNIYVMIGDLIEAEKHWNNSLKINEYVGNLDHEAKLLLNYGVFYYDDLEFEKAIVQYQRAENIFTSLGNKYGRGLALSNLGESYLRICEYQHSNDTLIESRIIFKNLKNKEEEAEVIFLLGQFYFQIGDVRQLNTLVEKFDKFYEKNSLIKKHKNNLDFLRQMNLFLNKDYSKVINEMHNVLKNYSSQNDRENNYYYSNGVLILAKALIEVKDFDKAVFHLNGKNFLEFCNFNKLLQAERLYLLSIISAKERRSELESEIDYLEKAYEIIENQSLSELSWKINFSIAMFYFERGNIKKAENYVDLAKSIISYISDSITSLQIKSVYLEENNRKYALETLTRYSEHI
ncbi:MAG: serine/threonine-protein kinase [Bacteroidetes bacterium]|nr:serine/threonine-protein kinase [Bacteroidota bacterium]